MVKIRILMADDHQLFRKGVCSILNQSPLFEVIGEASDGNELFNLLEEKAQCDVILLDVNMPRFNGFQTMNKLNRKGIQIPVLVLSMEEDEKIIIQFLKLGVKGYILKDSDPHDLMDAIITVSQNKFFLNGALSESLADFVSKKKRKPRSLLEEMSDRELEFLSYTPTELTYKEIAEQMGVGFRSVDYYRDTLFERLHVKTRVGLALAAIKIGMFKVE